jgi:hypothetical protein
MATKTSAKQMKWQTEYDARSCTHVSLKLHNNNDSDILQWLSEKPSRQGAIKDAIRFKIEAEEKENNPADM